jgi:hypothetical protein
LDRATEELEEVNSRLAEIEQERLELEQRRVILRTKVETLGPICVELEDEESKKLNTEWDDLAEAGIQECCYRILVDAKEPLSAAGIRSRLDEMGIDINRYANPLAVIHTSLKRLPDRVRSLRGQAQDLKGRNVSVRYYEVIPDKKVGASALNNNSAR